MPCVLDGRAAPVLFERLAAERNRLNSCITDLARTRDRLDSIITAAGTNRHTGAPCRARATA